jgi:hypothetical protein
MHEDFGTPNTQEEKVESLLHLYIDGGLPRREMIQRLTRLVGGSAAAMATLETAGLAQVNPGACPAGIQVTENDPAIQWQDVTFPGGRQRLLRRFLEDAAAGGHLLLWQPAQPPAAGGESRVPLAEHILRD